VQRKHGASVFSVEPTISCRAEGNPLGGFPNSGKHRHTTPMDTFDIESISKLMQLSVSPAVLISGVGLLLLSVTNRLGRAIDKSRSSVRELALAEGERREQLLDQLHILLRRAGLLRTSVCLLVGSIFFSCLMILLLFLKGFGGLHAESALIGSFLLNLLVLLGSVAFLLADVFLSLKALRIEVARHLR